MELLIRSQNRESLIRYENLFYFNTCNEMESVGKNYILNKIWIGDKDCIVLGEYKSKERALEVLDEIQNKIKPQSIYKEYHNEIKDGKNKLEFELVMTPKESTIEIIEPHTIIYEMPKE